MMKLTDDEKRVLETSLKEGYIYITRDNYSEDLNCHMSKPYRHTDEYWLTNSTSNETSEYIDDDVDFLSFITWDNEPLLIKDLLK